MMDTLQRLIDRNVLTTDTLMRMLDDIQAARTNETSEKRMAVLERAERMIEEVLDA